MILTIAIPTFNRNEILKENLAKLLPQLTSECFLLILDSHSPVPVAETLRELLAQYPKVRSTIVRHRFNIGGDFNILRCFELCETPWLWVLGDDDPPCNDAIATIFDTINRWPQVLFVNFSSAIHRWPENKPGQGSEEFIDKLGFAKLDSCFCNVLFISTCLYRVEPLFPYYVHGAKYCSGNAPHFVMLLLALQDHQQFILLNETIVNWTPTTAETGWSILGLLLFLPINMDLPIEFHLRKRLRAILASSSLHMMGGLRTLLLTLLFLVERKRLKPETAVYMMDQIYGRGLCYHPNWWRRLGALVLTILVRIPRLSLFCLRLQSRLMHRKPLNFSLYYVDREIASAKQA